jgi:general secretion pathway protein K
LPRGTRDEEKGFALVSVLAIVAVLAILVTGFALASRHSLALSRNAIEAAQAQAHAEAGVSLALAHLLDPDLTRRWNGNGSAHVVTVGGATVTVTLQDEAGKIDLNWGPLELLGSLMAEVGVPADAARDILDAVAARRQAGGLPDAAPGDRSSAALLGGPRLRDLANAPFRLVDDLKALPGLSQESFDRLRPFVTVYAQSRHVDPACAPRAVLSTLPGIAPQDTDTILAARVPAGGQPQPTIPDEALPFVGGAADQRAITITAIAGTPAIARRAVVALTGSASQPFRILEWQQDFDR